jgi:dihydropteroate synthase
MHESIDWSQEHIHVVTGKLAEYSLRRVLEHLAPRVGFSYSVQVMNITVAALMTTTWIGRKLTIPSGTTRVLLPGAVRGELESLTAASGVPVVRGPEDLRRLAEYFGQQSRDFIEYGRFDIEIVAEINHAPRMHRDAIVLEARRLKQNGADIIDFGCDPGDVWNDVDEAVKALKAEGFRVSIDSFEPREILKAVRAGAELVLSVNSTNVAAAADWNCEVVVVPDVPATLEGLDETVERLRAERVPMRIDPVLEPIGFGFAASLGRYLEVRRRWPDAELFMGIGNLTELTDVDSAGLNVLLLGFCQEVGIRGVLTTEVIHWAASSVRECSLARSLVYHAVTNKTLPKHVEPKLVTLRGGRPQVHGAEILERLARSIRDPNLRFFSEEDRLHIVGAGFHISDRDPFELFKQLRALPQVDIDSDHAFYVGYELSKAATALVLGKDYRQDQALDWGFLTRDEIPHRSSHAIPAVRSCASEKNNVTTDR